MSWIKNCWYQAGWSSEVESGAMLTRTFLDVPVVIYRLSDGKIAALLDRCPHRFAPLSAGTLENDIVVCGYHGLGFGADGKCAHNPHGRISAGLKVDAYPMVEKHSALWIWLGDPSLADDSLIPDLTFIDDTPLQGRICGYMPTKANYQLITDNILDLSHADYVHPHTLGGMMTEADFNVKEEGEDIVSSWEAKNANPPGIFKQEIVPPQRGDFYIDVRWSAPAVMVLRVVGKPTGEPFNAEDFATTLHNMVPETAGTTHYFYCSTRITRIDDREFMAMLKKGLEHSFVNEDKPMLEKQQLRIGTADFWSLKPKMLSIDKGSVLVRRKLDRMIQNEQQQD